MADKQNINSFLASRLPKKKDEEKEDIGQFLSSRLPDVKPPVAKQQTFTYLRPKGSALDSDFVSTLDRVKVDTGRNNSVWNNMLYQNAQKRIAELDQQADPYGKALADERKRNEELKMQVLASRFDPSPDSRISDLLEESNTRLSQLEAQQRGAVPGRDKLKQIAMEKAGLEDAVRKYERTQKPIDEGYQYMSKSDFRQTDTTAGGLEDRLGTFLNADDNQKAAAARLASGDFAPDKGYNLADGDTFQRSQIINEGTKNNWGQLRQEEVKAYYYIRQHQGQEAADKWLDDMAPALNRRADTQMQTQLESLNGWEKAGANALSVLTSPAGNIEAFVDDAAHVLTGRELDPYNSAHRNLNLTSGIRAATAKDIEKVFDSPLARKFAANTYQAIMSALDSVYGGVAFGAAYTPVMGLGAASQRAKELYDQGASKEQIAIGAAGSGILEALTEYVSLDHFAKNFLEKPLTGTARKKFVQFVGKVLVQGGVEASEEVASEVGNLILDAINRGVQSDTSQRVRQLQVENGKSASEAKTQAFWENLENIWWAGFGGFISGGGLGAIGGGFNMAVDKINSNRYADYMGRNLINNGTAQQTVEQAKEAGVPVNKKLMAIAEEKAGLTSDEMKGLGKKESKQAARAIGKVYSALEQSQIDNVRQTEMPLLQNAIQTEMEKKGVAKPEQAARIVAKAEYGEPLSYREERIYNAVKDKVDVQAIQNSEAFQQQREADVKPKTEVLRQTMLNAADADNPMNPKTVAAQKQRLAELAADSPAGESLTASFEDGQNAEDYAEAYEAAYAIGENGMDWRFANRSSRTQYLSESQRKAAYEAGRKAGENGESSVYQSQKWNDRPSAARQTESMAVRTGEEISRSEGSGSAGKEAAGKVSAASLGIRNGTQTESLTVRSADRYTDADKATIAAAKAEGYNLTLVEGEIEVTENGQTFTVNAQVDGDNIFVRADHEIYDSNQLFDHEHAHKRIEKGEIGVEATRRELLKRFKPKEIQQIIDLYADAYGMENSGMEPEALAQYIMEEIICDAQAGMNIFADVDSYSDIAGDVGVFLRQTAKNTKAGTVQNVPKAKASRDLRTPAELRQANRYLEQKVQRLQEQMKLTEKPTARKEDVRKLASKLIREYGAKQGVNGFDSKDFTAQLQEMADMAVNDKPTDAKALTQFLKLQSLDAARQLLEAAQVDMNEASAETYQDLRQYLRKSPIKLTAEIQNGMPDFADFRKRNRYVLRWAENGTAMDQMWLELQDQFGEHFFPDDISNPSDQLEHLVDTLDRLSPDIDNPFRGRIDQALDGVANEIFDRVTGPEVMPAPETKADKIAREAAEAAMVENAAPQISAAIAEYAQREKANIERRRQSDIRRKIYRLTNTFRTMVDHPTAKVTQHAPPDLLRSVVEFSAILNEAEERRQLRWRVELESRSDKAVSQLMKQGGNPSKALTSEFERIAKLSQRQQELLSKAVAISQEYAAMQNDESFAISYNEETQGALDAMRDSIAGLLKGTDLQQLDSEALQSIYSALNGLRYSIVEANNAFFMGKQKKVSDIAQRTASAVVQVNEKTPGMQAAAQRFMQWHYSPDTFFDYICGYIKDNEGQKIQAAFAKGTETMLSVQRGYYNLFREITESQDKAIQKELKELLNPMRKKEPLVGWGLQDQAGNEVKTTRGMMLQAYMMMKQRDSRRSLAIGGFTLPNASTYYSGKIDAAYGNMKDDSMFSKNSLAAFNVLKDEQMQLFRELDKVKADDSISDMDRSSKVNALENRLKSVAMEMNEMEADAERRLSVLEKNIQGQLTPLEKRLIEKAHEWYRQSGLMMKDVYMKMYGFVPPLVENYVPIHRDLSTVKTDLQSFKLIHKAFMLENSGFTNYRVKSYRPILLTDFFVELEGQKTKMSRYIGFAGVQKDFGKIWMCRLDSTGRSLSTLVRARFGHGNTMFGVSGERYIENYLQSIVGQKTEESILSKWYGNSAGATLAFNPRVAVSQLASIPTAWSVVGVKACAKGFTKGVGKAFSTTEKNALAEKNAWYWQRLRGEGSGTELADLRNSGGIIGRIAKSDVGKYFFNWCQNFDTFATGPIMWEMAKERAMELGYQEGSVNFDTKVNEIYTDILRLSQPNYTATERSDFLRDQRSGMKLLNMFKTQSNQNLNLLIRANGQFQRARMDFKNGRNGVTQADVTAARRNMANAFTSVFLGGTAFFVLLRTLVNFAMAQVKPYRRKDTGEITVSSTLSAVGKETMSSIAGMIALGGPVYDAFYSVVSGDRYYGLSDSAIGSISDVLESTVAVLQRAADEEKDITPAQWKKMAVSWSNAYGIPLNNALKILNMVKTYYTDLKNGTFGQFTTDEITKKQYGTRILEGFQQGDSAKVSDNLAILWAQSDGDTDEECRKDIASYLSTYVIKDAFTYGDLTAGEAEKLLETVGYSDPAGRVKVWEFNIEVPDYKGTASAAMATKYFQRGKIDGKVFLDAYAFANSAKADKDKDGKAISGSKKAKIIAYIDKLNLSTQNKKLLWDLVKGDSKDDGIPWR